jgi:hypothetical protein
MGASSDDFGAWLTAPDGKAHYVLGGKCLCGARVKKFGGPPAREQLPNRPPGKWITPYCDECETENFVRWAKKGGRSARDLAERVSYVKRLWKRANKFGVRK